jgi:hypothetical protein
MFLWCALSMDDLLFAVSCVSAAYWAGETLRDKHCVPTYAHRAIDNTEMYRRIAMRCEMTHETRVELLGRLVRVQRNIRAQR